MLAHTIPGFPEHLSGELLSKIEGDIFDAGESFQVQQTEAGERLVVASADVIGSHVWLVDHCVSFRMSQLRGLVTAHAGLCERLAGICGLGGLEADESELLDKVMVRIWPFVGLYTLNSAEGMDNTPICYVNDEFGAAVGHSDTPNVHCGLYLHCPPSGSLEQTVPYTLIWTDVGADDVALQEGETLVRDAFAHLPEREHRKWMFEEAPTGGEYTAIQKARAAASTALSASWRARVESVVAPETRVTAPDCSKLPLKVYTDVNLVHELLQREEFSVVEELQEADIAWVHDWIDVDDRTDGLEYDGAVISSHTIMNQFAHEETLVSKDGLSKLITERVGEASWWPVSYRLHDGELSPFIADYFARKAAGVDNIWIVKPAQSSESIGMNVTESLPQVLKITETGAPHVAQKYVNNPLLFVDKRGNGFKFHLRVTVALRSILPLEIFVHKLCYARVAGEPYTEDSSSLCEFSRQFTSQDRGEHMHLPSTQVQWQPELGVFSDPPEGVIGTRRVQISEVIPVLEAAYSERGFKWERFEGQMHDMIHEAFLAFADEHPEAHAEGRSRTMYAVDVMIQPDGTPAMLEVQFTPNFEHQAGFEPGFIDGLFSLLFLGQNTNERWVQAGAGN